MDKILFHRHFKAIEEGKASSSIPSLLAPDYNAYLPTTLIANVRSLVPKVDELEQTIKRNEVDMICFTETWLHPSMYCFEETVYRQLVVMSACILMPNYIVGH